MRPVRGQTAFVRDLRDDLAPMFGMIPFTVEMRAEWDMLGRDIRVVVIHWRGGQPEGKAYYWPPYGCMVPVRPSVFTDPPMRRLMIDRIGMLIWRQYLPQQRRSRRRLPAEVGG